MKKEYTESEKEAYKAIRTRVLTQANGGGYAQRCNLLAYAFIKGKLYSDVEYKINEDKFPQIGRDNFYNGLALDVGQVLKKVYNTSDVNFGKQVLQWIKVKYASKEVAA